MDGIPGESMDDQRYAHRDLMMVMMHSDADAEIAPKTEIVIDSMDVHEDVPVHEPEVQREPSPASVQQTPVEPTSAEMEKEPEPEQPREDADIDDELVLGRTLEI